MAKRLLKNLNYQFDEVAIDTDPELRQRLSAANGGWRTVPMIFIGEEFIGGFDELNKLHKSGELARKMEQNV